MSSLTRRSALKLGAGMTLTLVAVDDSVATPAEADAEIAKFTAAKAAETGKIDTGDAIKLRQLSTEIECVGAKRSRSHSARRRRPARI